MIKPTMHLNGTSASALAEQYQRASDALYDAIRALEECAPNARDYYPQGPQTFAQVQKEHAERVQRVRSVRQEVYALLEHCNDRVSV